MKAYSLTEQSNTKQVYLLAGEIATKALAKRLAPLLTPGLVIYLIGDLGAGKTTLVRALLHAMHYHGRVKSPTYTLCESYLIDTKETPLRVLHFDCYRLQDASEFIDAGFLDEFKPDTFCLIEWPQKVAQALPTADLCISLATVEDSEQSRRMTIEALSVQGKNVLDHL